MTRAHRTFDPVVLAQEMAKEKQSLIARLIAAYEAAFGMSGDEFMAAWRNGEIEDTFEANEFAILIRGDADDTGGWKHGDV